MDATSIPSSPHPHCPGHPTPGRLADLRPPARRLGARVPGADACQKLCGEKPPPKAPGGRDHQAFLEAAAFQSRPGDGDSDGLQLAHQRLHGPGDPPAGFWPQIAMPELSEDRHRRLVCFGVWVSLLKKIFFSWCPTRICATTMITPENLRKQLWPEGQPSLLSRRVLKWTLQRSKLFFLQPVFGPGRLSQHLSPDPARDQQT